jgi:DNA-binding transcriptional ArsR family regulator
MSVFPLRSAVDREGGDPRVLDIEAEDADAVFGALSSETAREVYGAVAEEPRTASDLAEALDSSIQNVRYHLDNLQEAGLVEVVDTWYSSRGSEMKVYGRSDGPLVLFAGDEESGADVRSALQTLVGGTVIFGLVGLLINYLLREPETTNGITVSASGQEAASTGMNWILALPGLLFVLGGMTALLVLTGYLVYTAR